MPRRNAWRYRWVVGRCWKEDVPWVRSQARMDLSKPNKKVTSGATRMAGGFTVSGLLREALECKCQSS